MNFKKIKVLGAKSCRKNLHKDPGPPFQIRPGPGCFSIALRSLHFVDKSCSNMVHKHLQNLSKTKYQGKISRESITLEL